jgi:hypothetical protein
MRTTHQGSCPSRAGANSMSSFGRDRAVPAYSRRDRIGDRALDQLIRPTQGWPGPDLEAGGTVTGAGRHVQMVACRHLFPNGVDGTTCITDSATTVAA